MGTDLKKQSKGANLFYIPLGMEGLDWIRNPGNRNKTSITSEEEILLCKATAKVGHRQQKRYGAEHGARSRETPCIEIYPRVHPQTQRWVSVQNGHDRSRGDSSGSSRGPRVRPPALWPRARSHLRPSLSIYAPWDQEINSPVSVLMICKSCQGAERGKEILIY